MMMQSVLEPTAPSLPHVLLLAPLLPLLPLLPPPVVVMVAPREVVAPLALHPLQPRPPQQQQTSMKEPMRRSGGRQCGSR